MNHPADPHMARDHFFDALWRAYTAVTPQALQIHALFGALGEQVINDHVAFRTFDRCAYNLESFVEVLGELGYTPYERYHFPEKHLDALALKTSDPHAPKIFVSELRRADLSAASREIVDRLVDESPNEPLTLSQLFGVRPWPLISYAEYERLANESEYAAWLSLMGLTANHFTVSVNHLSSFVTLEEVNRLLLDEGYQLNAVGGLIKGRPEVYLEQSSTLADRAPFTFTCGAKAELPTCFYEFAMRHPSASGELFQGFVTQNAQKIFDSTHR